MRITKLILSLTLRDYYCMKLFCNKAHQSQYFHGDFVKNSNESFEGILFSDQFKEITKRYGYYAIVHIVERNAKVICLVIDQAHGLYLRIHLTYMSIGHASVALTTLT